MGEFQNDFFRLGWRSPLTGRNRGMVGLTSMPHFKHANLRTTTLYFLNDSSWLEKKSTPVMRTLKVVILQNSLASLVLSPHYLDQSVFKFMLLPCHFTFVQWLFLVFRKYNLIIHSRKMRTLKQGLEISSIYECLKTRNTIYCY